MIFLDMFDLSILHFTRCCCRHCSLFNFSITAHKATSTAYLRDNCQQESMFAMKAMNFVTKNADAAPCAFLSGTGCLLRKVQLAGLWIRLCIIRALALQIVICPKWLLNGIQQQIHLKGCFFSISNPKSLFYSLRSG